MTSDVSDQGSGDQAETCGEVEASLVESWRVAGRMKENFCGLFVNMRS